MFSVFLEAVKRISVFMIISQTFLHLGIGVKYEKYVKFVISFMVVAQLIFSFSAYFSQKEHVFSKVLKQEYDMQWEDYMQEIERSFENNQLEWKSEWKENNIADKEKMERENQKDKNRKIVIDKIVVSVGR